MKKQSPIFVVGLPRSGSTLLSAILNESPDILSVNDLYYIQGVFAEDALNGALDKAKIRRLCNLIFNQASERSYKNNKFIGQFFISISRLRYLREDLLAEHDRSPLNWASLMDGALTRISHDLGKSRWADKTPQNFLHIDLLRKAFPGAKFIFLFRSPFDVLASYKYADGSGHDKRRYHPVLYSIYWRAAVRQYLTAGKQYGVHMVRYEDMIDRLPLVIKKLNQYLNTDIHVDRIEIFGDNSSFRKGKRKSITVTERWVCQKICYAEMTALGYGQTRVRPRFRDVPELLLLTCRAVYFQLYRLFFSKDGRKRIVALIHNIGGDDKWPFTVRGKR